MVRDRAGVALVAYVAALLILAVVAMAAPHLITPPSMTLPACKAVADKSPSC